MQLARLLLVVVVVLIPIGVAVHAVHVHLILGAGRRLWPRLMSARGLIGARGDRLCGHQTRDEKGKDVSSSVHADSLRARMAVGLP